MAKPCLVIAANKNDPTKIESGDAVTPEGLFRTTRERPEGWWEGDLGKIYRPKYFRAPDFMMR